MRLMEAGRGRKGPLERRTLGLTWNWSHVEDGKGGNRTGEAGRACARNSVGPYVMGGKRRQAGAAGRQECRIGGRSLYNRARERGGEELGAKRKIISVDR